MSGEITYDETTIYEDGVPILRTLGQGFGQCVCIKEAAEALQARRREGGEDGEG